MGVSFKISKTGTRFRAKPAFQSQSLVDEVSDELKEKPETTKQKGENLARVSPTEDELGISADNEVSFNLNLYRDGYSIGMPLEKEGVAQGTLEDVPKVLRPYDRASEILFSAIESGHLPGDFLDDVPCKFVNGTLVCEVRDFRSCKTEQGSSTVPTNASPVVTKVKLKMSLENVVKDIPLISDSSWTYGDLMEVESRILKALQPQLCLDPTPKLERLTTSPVSPQLKLTLGSLRRKRLRQIPEVTVTSNSKIHGKKVCIDRAPENSNSRLGDMGQISSTSLPQHMNENLTNQNLPPNHMLALRPKNLTSDATIPSVLANQHPRYPMGPAMSRSMPDQGSGSVVNHLGASLSGQEMMISYADNLNSASSSFHGKRENQDGQMSSLLNKRARLTQMGADGIPPQQMGSSVEGIKSTILARGIQYGNTGVQKYPQPVFDGVMKQEPGTIVTAAQQGMRFTPKEEQFEMDKMDGSSELNRGKDDMQVVGLDANHLDPHQSRLQRFSQYHAFMRSGIPQAAWNNVGQKEDQFQKRKSAQSPRLSTGALPQSPLSSKSGEFSSGSVGPNFGGVATSAAAMGVSQRDKSTVNSMQGFGGTQSMTSSANDSMHRRQHQAQVAANRRTNSLPKSSAMNGVGSPVSVGNMNVQVNAGSPTVGTPPMADQTMLDRFAKIEMVTRRYQLNAKKNKAENYPTRKKNTYSAQSLMVCLANASNNEDFKDEESPLSKSVINGSMNTDKIRVLNFSQPERIVQGGAVSVVNRGRSRMILSEKSSDGTVAMHYGDLEDGDILSAEDYLPTLPNARMADLLASQFSSLMQRDGWIVEDRVQQKPTRMNIPPSNPPPHASGIPPNNPGVEMQQYNDAISGQQSGEVANATGNNNVSLASSQSVLANPRNMLPPGNMSQGLLSGASMPPRPQQQLEPQASMQPQQQPQQSQLHQQTQNQHQLMHQQQQLQFPRSSPMMLSNQLSHLHPNMQMGNQMGNNKPSPLQLQMLQQQQQHQQQQPQPHHQQQQQQQQPQHQQAQLQQRKMMMGLGTAVSMGSMGTNNLVGLGGLGNSHMGMGGARSGISTPMAPMSSMAMGNVGQNPFNLSQASNISNVINQQLRSGKITPQQAAFMASKLKRASMPQSGIAGIPGAGRQMLPGSAGLSSMLSQNLNRANMNPMQRTAMGQMGPMGPPKLMAGMNPYTNQQQMQLQHQQLQQQLHQQQLQQQQQLQLPPQQPTTQQVPPPQQQETVVSPPQVGSPSAMAIPQVNPAPPPPQQQQQMQQPSPQQMNQRTPMSPQLSSGAMHAMSTGNPEACPASPQLSSQTLGSVGSITNSPMELQGVNKSNSVS